MEPKYTINPETGVFTLHDPDVGKLWYNQLWNEDGYHMSISHTGTGISRYVDESGNQAILNEEEARYLYIRDDADSSFWNIGISPAMTAVNHYTCEHGQGYSRIASEYSGIEASLTFALPDKGTCEAWKVTIRNRSAVHRTLSIFPLIRFDLGGFVQPHYYGPQTTSETKFLEEINGIICHSKNPHQPHERYSGYLAASESVQSYEGWLEKFIGCIGNYARPDLLVRGKGCTNSLATVRVRGAVLQNTISLAPGAERILYYVAGFSTGPEAAVQEYRQAIQNLSELFNTAEQRGKERFGTLKVITPDKQINQIMNYWAQKQVSFCMIGKKAVRDNAQIAMGMLNYDAELAEKTLYECISHQYSDGHAVLGWSPALDPKIYSDPPMWLILAVCELIKETGNLQWLECTVPFLDGGSATIYEHLKRAADWLLENNGPNQLPLIHYADWNDALNIPDPEAESVFMAMGVAWALKELMELSRHIGERDYADALGIQRDFLVDRINDVAWNGDYYVRALSTMGTVGDKNSPAGGNIYINPQTWAILADVVPQDRIQRIFEAIDSMETDYGIPLCKPAYTEYYDGVGRMSGMLPGVYENGGIYNHACGFKIMADCKAGRKEAALESLIKMIPDGEHNPSSITTAEPYVFTNCYLMHPSVFLAVGFSWQTGASAWALRSFYEGILGLRRDYAGLIIEPCITNKWDTVNVQRKFRGCTYEITYLDKGGNRLSISVDGVEINGNVLPLYDDGKIHKVIVNLY